MDQDTKEALHYGKRILEVLLKYLNQKNLERREKLARENFDELSKHYPHKVDVVTIDPNHKEEFLMRAEKEGLTCFDIKEDLETNDLNIFFSKDDTGKMGIILNKLGKDLTQEDITLNENNLRALDKEIEKLKEEIDKIDVELNDDELSEIVEELKGDEELKNINIEEIDVKEFLKEANEINRNELFENDKNNSYRDIIENIENIDSPEAFDRSINIPEEYWNDFKAFADKNKVNYSSLENISNKHKIEFSSKDRENVIDFLKEKETNKLTDILSKLKEEVKLGKKSINKISQEVKPLIDEQRKIHQNNKLKNKDIGEISR